MNQQSVTLIYKGDDVRVHATGCKDVAKDSRGAVTVYDFTASSLREIANDFYADFLDGGEMTEDEALAYCDFAPCVHLVESAPPAPVDAFDAWCVANGEHVTISVDGEDGVVR